MKAFSELTVVTSSVKVTQELQDHPSIDVHLLGGSLRKETLALVGPMTEHALDMIQMFCHQSG
ncbi:DeoR/GlpR family DNA-binding transcription regulator [Salipaludibacillus neizhouensis]|uniref:hypothetical protein n=1 Tax=Salipaludibacillus neizhouensis TaxID=885475 RepID=UPI001CBA655E|nr:hypothetical protein [Salipaludibacillus neizhouensis]